MNIELKSSSIEEFIECDESISTDEDKEIYDLVVNNEEEMCETNDNENVEEIPIIEITKNEAVKNFKKSVQ